MLAPSAGAAEPRPQPRQYRRRVGLRRVCGRILENMPWWWWWLDDMLPLPHTHAAASQRPPSRQSALARVFAARLCYRGPAGLPEHQPDRPRASGSAATPEKRDPGPKQSPRASAAVPLPSARAQQDKAPPPRHAPSSTSPRSRGSACRVPHARARSLTQRSRDRSASRSASRGAQAREKKRSESIDPK